MVMLLRQLMEIRGRLREADSLGVEVQARNVARGARVDPLTLPIRQSLHDAFLRGQSEQAVSRLDAAIRAHPLTRESLRGTMLEAAVNYSIAGAPERARPILAQFDAAAGDSINRESWVGQRVYAEGTILLAERRIDDAIRTFRRLDVLPDGLPGWCEFCGRVALARAYDQANVADSTIANLERYLTISQDGRSNVDTWFLGPARKRLGELYEAKGDTKRAAEQYAAFVELWKRADPDLQPKVTEVRGRLERLRRALPQ